MTSYLLNLLYFTIGTTIAVFLIAGVFVAGEKLFRRGARPIASPEPESIADAVAKS